ncbi:MAG: ribosome-binding factor A [Lachnospiraceae bacterium]|nr:ribosome-binding factor A [Lachnospiraceae bacterium]
MAECVVTEKEDYMESTRQQKISRLLQKELSDIFLKLARNNGGVIITVTSINVSADLSIAHINLSLFPTDKGEAVMELIKLNDKNIRFELGNRMRHQLRIIPELVFHLDDTLDYIDHIDDLLKKDKERLENNKPKSAKDSEEQA